MDGDFGEALSGWVAFYAFTGGSAATLLGLLFVAVSLRLDLFQRREVADVRDYAAFAFVSLLGAMVVSGIALAPHVGRRTLASPLILLGVVGLLAGAGLLREWACLNSTGGDGRHPTDPIRRESMAVLVLTLLPFVGLVGVGGLAWRGQDIALPALAIVQGLLLASAAAASWALLSHARGGSGP